MHHWACPNQPRGHIAQHAGEETKTEARRNCSARCCDRIGAIRDLLRGHPTFDVARCLQTAQASRVGHPRLTLSEGIGNCRLLDAAIWRPGDVGELATHKGICRFLGRAHRDVRLVSRQAQRLVADQHFNRDPLIGGFEVRDDRRKKVQQQRVAGGNSQFPQGALAGTRNPASDTDDVQLNALGQCTQLCTFGG
ncbi:hypothetical protein D3C80_1446210 [compost metagenome]